MKYNFESETQEEILRTIPDDMATDKTGMSKYQYTYFKTENEELYLCYKNPYSGGFFGNAKRNEIITNRVMVSI